MGSKWLIALLIGLLALVVMGLGLSYYTGYASERALLQHWALHQERAARHGYDLTLEGYRRGWFRSSAQWRLASLVGHEQNPAAGLELSGELQLQHGPVLLTSQGWQPGLFALTARLDEASEWGTLGVEAAPEKLLEELWVVGHFGRHYQVDWALPDVQLAHQNQSLSLRGASLAWQGRYEQLAGQGQVSAHRIVVRWPNQLSLTISDSELDIALAYLNDWALEGEGHFTSQQAIWAGPGQLPLQASELRWQWRQWVERGRLVMEYDLNLAKLNAGPLALRDLRASTQIDGLPVQVLRRWQKQAQVKAAVEEPLFHAQRWLALADDGFREELAADGSIKAQVGQGELRADWQADYRGLPEDRRLAFEHWRDWAALFNAELDVRLDEVALSGNPLYWLLAEPIDRYLLPDGNQRRLNARWQDGELRVNPR